MTRPNSKLRAAAPQKRTLKPLNALMQRMFSSWTKPVLKKRTVAAEPAPRIKFETLEPRVLLSGDINPAAVTLSGAIDVAGERDQYEFSVSDPTRVIFDGLTNNSNLSWTLNRDGQSIQSGTFGAPDSYVSAWDLQSGKYVLTIDGSGDKTGSYNLRLIDASAAADLTPGIQVTNTLEAANKTALYRFTANAGDQLYFDADQVAGGTASWRLIDPYGKQELNPSSLTQDKDTFTVQRSGTYLLALDGDNSNTAPVLSYSFNLRPVQDKQSNLVLDQETSATIDTIGQRVSYRFTLTQDQAVLFDPRTSDNAFTWSLSGPRGNEFNQQNMSYGGGERRLLPAGEYTLTIDAAGAKTGSADFKILTRASLQTLPDGVPVAGTLERSNGTTLYRVSANAGDRLLFAGQSASGGGATARLLDPYGNAVWSGLDIRSNSPVISAQFGGDYWLAIDGATNNDPVTRLGYEFTLHRVADTTTSVTLGDKVEDALTQPGQSAYYTFTLASPTTLIYDSQTNDNDMLLSLDGPRGNEWQNLPFGAAESNQSASTLLLPAGHYRLAVRGQGTHVGPFAFRLLDSATALPLTVGATVSHTVTPGNATQLYQFNVAAGDKLSFDSIAVSGGSGTWRLIDRYGRNVSSTQNLAVDATPLTLTTGGTYSLVVEGANTNSSALNISFALVAAGNQAPTALPAGSSLAFGAIQAGSVSNGNDQVYRFSLASDSLLIFDSQAYSFAANWSLTGPRGEEVSLRAFANSDNPYASQLSSPAGDYALTVKGNGGYAFRLLNAAALPSLILGTPVSASLSPANETDGYRFNASAGDRFTLRVPNGASRGNLKIIDPFGRAVVDQSFYSGAEFSTAVAGTYVLLYEAPPYATGSVNYTFTLNKATTVNATLALDNAISGELTAAAQTFAYNFDLTDQQLVHFAPQTEPSTSTRWKLTGPTGDVFGWRSSYDFSSYLGQVFDLQAGHYTLSVTDASDATGAFKFQMLTSNAATGLVLGTDISGELQPNGVALYRFDASAGERLYFDDQGMNTYPSVQWKLLDPFGRTVKTGATSSDSDPFTVATGGEYLLAMSAYSNTSATAISYAFNLRSAAEVRTSVNLDTDIVSAIAQPGERHVYGFSLTGSTAILVDSWSSQNNIQWRLTGPRGSEASQRSLRETGTSLMQLPAGNYEFSVESVYGGAGDFGFRLVDLANAPVLTANIETLVSLNPGNRSAAYRVTVDADQHYFYDFNSGSGAAIDYGYWRLIDSSGRTASSGQLSDVGDVANAAPGNYWLVLDGYGSADQAADLSFSWRNGAIRTEAVLLNTPVQGNLAERGAIQRYTFTTQAPSQVLFDNLGASADLAILLEGPTGTVIWNSNPAYLDSATNPLTPINLLAAGNYVLTIQSTGRNITDFAFNLHDLSKAPALSIGAPQALTLTPGSGMAVFALNATASEVLNYHAQSVSAGDVRYTIVDAHNHVIRTGQDAGTDSQTLLAAPGKYYLIFAGTEGNSAPVEVTFAAQLLGNREQSLNIGAVAQGNLAHATAKDTWTFSVTGSQRLIVDTLSGQSGLEWELQDATGTMIASRGWNETAVATLQAGEYRMVVRATAANATGDYGFQLLDTVNAAALDAIVAGALTTSGAATILSIDAASHSHVLLDVESGNVDGSNVVVAQLFDAFGNLVMNSTVPLVAAELRAATLHGNYLLVLDPSNANAQSVTYHATLRPIVEQVLPAFLGDRLQGNLGNDAQFDTYRITATLPTLLVVRNVASDANGAWRLDQGPNTGDWTDLPVVGDVPLQVRAIAAGDYELTVSSGAIDGGNYSLRLLDANSAQAAPTNSTAVTLPAGSDSAIYRVAVHDGEKLDLLINPVVSDSLGWALYRGNGDLVATSIDGLSQTTSTLTGDDYVLVVYKTVADTVPVDFDLAVKHIGAAGIQFGETINGEFTSGANYVKYRLSVTEKTILLFDAINAPSAYYRVNLRDASDSSVATWYFGEDATNEPRTLDIGPGEYSVIVDPGFDGSGETTDFAFRLFKLAQSAATPTALGDSGHIQLAIGSQAQLFTFAAQSGDFVTLEPTQSVYDSGTWRVIDQWGRTVAQRSWDQAMTDVQLPATGDYFIVVDGDYYNRNTVSFDFSLALTGHADIVLPAGQTVLFGEPITGSAIPAVDSVYRFTLTDAALVSIFGTSNSYGIQWQLTGPRGEELRYPETFSGSYSAARLLALPPGDYALSVRDSGEGSQPQVFEFRIDNSNAATTLALSDTLTLTSDAQSNRLFKVELQADDVLRLQTGYLDDAWELWSSDGVRVAQSNSVYESARDINIRVPGSYYLWFREGAYGSGELTVQHSTVQRNTLTVGTEIGGTFASNGARAQYDFTLTNSGLYWFDQIESSGLSYSLQRDGLDVAVNTDEFWALAAGEYTLTLTGDTGAYRARLLAASSAQALSLENENQASLIAGQSMLFSFDVNQGQSIRYTPNSNTPSFARASVFDAFGHLVSDAFDADASRLIADLPRSGHYYLVLDYATIDIADFAFSITPVAASPLTALALNQPAMAALGADQAARFSLSVDMSTQVWLDSAATGWLWEVRDLQGALVGNLADGPLTLAAGEYSLVARNADAVMGSSIAFRLRSAQAATALVSGQVIQSAIDTASQLALYRFSAKDGESWAFKRGGATNGSLPWTLFDRNGYAIATGNTAVSFDTTLAGGTYVLAINGAANTAYGFTTYLGGIPLTFGSLVSGNLASSDQHDTYKIHLDQDSSLLFDSQTTLRGLSWRLQDTSGSTLFQSGMPYYSYGNYYNTYYAPQADVVQAVPAGDYVLSINADPGKSGNYAFRVSDLATATPIVPGAPVTGSLRPANESDIYRFSAQAGERYFFDSVFTAGVNWRVLDPIGRQVFSSSFLSDSEPDAFRLSGTYTVLVEGDNTRTGTAANYAFNVLRVPNTPPVIIDSLQTIAAPDLYVNSVTLAPATNLTTGDTVNISWVVENRGVMATIGNWNDRIIVRNLDTGVILGSITVPYDATNATNGAIAPGAARTRSIAFVLPSGSTGAGRLSFTVIADADGLIKESNSAGNGESNNARVVEATVALAPYLDLRAEGLTISPAADWTAGTSVTVTWATANRGNQPIDTAWNERLELRNLSTGTVVLTRVIHDDVTTSGSLVADASRPRSVTFAWPDGLGAIGQFQLRLLVDTDAAVTEANPEGSGESNNLTQRLLEVGPDLQVRNLTIAQSGIEAGGLVTLTWQDVNAGTVPVPTSYSDRIVVSNNTTGQIVIDTAIDQLLAAGENLAPGAVRERSLTFRLPEGLRGAGELELRVIADQNNAGIGVLFETNLAHNGEANNAAMLSVTSQARAYADLQVTAVTTPATATAGKPVAISWTVSNTGAAASGLIWTDQIILSRDNVIGNADDLILANLRVVGPLTAGSSYSQTISVNLPLGIQGNYYFAVKTDSAAEVLEPDTRANNISAVKAIDIAAAYADLAIESISAPNIALSGENVQVSWQVRNLGNAATDLVLWSDRVMLSRDLTPSADDIILAGAITHAGLLDAGQSYVGLATLTLPRDLQGDFYVLVDVNAARSVSENGRTGNNVGASAAPLKISLAPTADLTVANVTGSTQLCPGDTATVSYVSNNSGSTQANGPWRDRIFLQDSAGNLTQVADNWVTTNLAVGTSESRVVSFVVPAGFQEGQFSWVVRTDVDNTVYERGTENNNQAIAADTVAIARTDLIVSQVTGPSLIRSGESLQVQWQVTNTGGRADGNWVDRVYLSKNGNAILVAERGHTGGLAAGNSYAATVDVVVPIDYSGEYEIVVVTNATRTLSEAPRDNNRNQTGLHVELAPYADLVVSNVTAPAVTIADPATIQVSWTVANQGNGAGSTNAWTDRVVLSKDDIIGNGDDVTIGEYRHVGSLDVGQSYLRAEQIQLPLNTSGRFRLFVVSDAKNEVFENAIEANNAARVSHDVDIMPRAYADLQVESVTSNGTAASGKPLRVTWSVLNNGIAITNSGSWSDEVWLSRNPDGTDVVKTFAEATHLGQLAVGDRYVRSIDVTLPEGIEGTFYLNVQTGGTFEFIYDKNNRGTSTAIPVTLSRSPDLIVESIALPVTGQEGELFEMSWTVVNQGDAAATGSWSDSVILIPASGIGDTIVLGNFSYDRGLEPGIRYTRTEQLRLPSKIEGQYRVRVITNANFGRNGEQVYEHGAANTNNILTSTETTELSLSARPDLRIGTVSVPDHVTAGTAVALRYTVTNQGPVATTGRWVDNVYLSLDGTFSSDDLLIGRFDNGSSLAPTESYSNETGRVDIPIRFRGDAYLIVVADGLNRIDEYPNENNNAKGVKFFVDPIPFADLVTSNVVAPDQAVHGAGIEVRYTVANRGSDITRGESSSVNSWTDSIWLARDRTRPGASKGDILLGTVDHRGNLAVGEDYLGTAQVSIPEGTLSGHYYITVWSDTYDVILEDSLAANVNPDDPGLADSSNYKARAIDILGITPPDLVVSNVSTPPLGEGGSRYSFSYTVQNRGDVFEGKWTDSVYITDNLDFSKATKTWLIGTYEQERSLANGEQYTVNQAVELAPAVTGRYVVVKTDFKGFATDGVIKESDEGNNIGSTMSSITAAAADLQVTAITTEPENFSGEETLVTFTVTNFGAAVWSGTQTWNDSIYISRDAVFIPERATRLGQIEHANVSGLASGASYTTAAKVNLPQGADGPYYIYVITDSDDTERGKPKAHAELPVGALENDKARDLFYSNTAYESQNNNNIARGTLEITYREPDLQIDAITLSDPNPASGQEITVTWTATNRGERATRSVVWFDGIYLSQDVSLDESDYPLVDRGTDIERISRVRKTVIYDEHGEYTVLKPGESYTNSATFRLPDSISGDFHIIVKTDTSSGKGSRAGIPSSIREGLDTIAGDGPGSINEFKDEGNNEASIVLPIRLATPPDLQVAEVTAPASMLAGQTANISYHVTNSGGAIPSDQAIWTDLVYFSKDRFLDLKKDRYVGYVYHTGGLAANGSYDGNLTISVPRDLDGAYYLFVVTDPANYSGSDEFGKVREFGNEQNNATTAIQPIVIQVPPPADLKVSNVVVPNRGTVGEVVEIQYTIANDSNNPAYGRWTDAVYLSADNAWDLGDILLGKVDHVGDVTGNGTYSGNLKANLPPLKDGNWRIIVRPDLYNEVFEGKITYTDTGVNLPPGEANNRQASGSTLRVEVPVLAVASPLNTTLSTGQSRVYKVSVAPGETLRVSLDAERESGANEVYVRFGDVPTSTAFDAAYDNPLSPDQQVLIPSTRAGDYYILVRSRQSAMESPVTLRADLLPLAITRVTPDQGGTGDDDHRWVTLDIYGARFQPGALVKLNRPGVAELEPQRWQVIDATHIRAVFDLRDADLGLYDVSVTNPDGQRVTDAYRYLIERGIEADVTIGIGGPRNINPGERGTYSVALQSVTNVDTPYVRFDLGVPNMGKSEDVLAGLNLPYVVFASNVGGRPDGKTVEGNGNTQAYGTTPTDGTPRADIPWASLDGSLNTNGFSLAPGYAFDVTAGGFVGMSFNVQTYPGLAEWIAHDFDGLREKLYLLRPDWKAQGLLDNGVYDLNKIQKGLTARFLSTDPKVHISEKEALAIPFRFNIAGAVTPLTRDEFIAEQTAHALKLLSAILADVNAPVALSVLASDQAQWVKGWFGALEAAGLLRPLDEAPPIRNDAKVLSLNATLASGILLSKAGQNYRTQADILSFFAKVQQWYGDTARTSVDPNALTAPIEYAEYRVDIEGNEVNVPVPAFADPNLFDRKATQDTHLVNFNVFAGSITELEYLRHQGLLDEKFRPIGPQALNLTQYLQQSAQQTAAAQSAASIRGPQGALDSVGNSYLPADTALPYSIAFNNPSERAVGELRIVTQIDADLDVRTLRLGDIKLGDINIHIPADRANFQGDFDFSGNKGFILRVSGGIDAATHVATWLLQAIDPDTGEVLHDAVRGLLAPSSSTAQSNSNAAGFVSYSVTSSATAESGAAISAQARVFFDDAPR